MNIESKKGRLPKSMGDKRVEGEHFDESEIQPKIVAIGLGAIFFLIAGSYLWVAGLSYYIEGHTVPRRPLPRASDDIPLHYPNPRLTVPRATDGIPSKGLTR
ncbi:MAG: hypothetical protein H7249_02275 [Chitinophagaceae bacterium]|nr:hypothetical protein [Oligoflexus sp.]